jgi:hypothetical protein
MGSLHRLFTLMPVLFSGLPLVYLLLRSSSSLSFHVIFVYVALSWSLDQTILGGSPKIRALVAISLNRFLAR